MLYRLVSYFMSLGSVMDKWDEIETDLLLTLSNTANWLAGNKIYFSWYVCSKVKLKVLIFIFTYN
jgi:hypothetical protein